MEKMTAAGKHNDRQLLRPRPGEDIGQRHHLVLLAVDDDGVGGYGLKCEAAHGRPDQHEALGGDGPCDARLDKGAKRKSRKDDRQIVTETLPRIGQRGQCIRGLAVAFIEGASGRADTTEVEAHGHVAQREERARQCLRHLVVERAALQRVRMGDERDALRRAFRDIADDLKQARRPGDGLALRGTGCQMRSRSTTSPFTMCRSTISSISSRSTYVYQTASG